MATTLLKPGGYQRLDQMASELECGSVEFAGDVYKRQLVALCYRVNNFVHISVALADVHVITDTDHVSHCLLYTSRCV